MSGCWPCTVKDKSRILYAFDFDKTILDNDSEAMYSKLLSRESLEKVIRIYNNNGDNWLITCQLKSDLAYAEGIRLEDVLEEAKKIPLTTGMDDLLHAVEASVKSKPRSRFLIISGATDLMITTVLGTLNPPVTPHHIISNYATPAPQGSGTIVHYKTYEDQFSCPLCCRVLCKGNALLRYCEAQGPFEKIYYVGDGTNDICPALRLRECDVLFVRSGYLLEKHISEGSYGVIPLKFRARIIYFENADIIKEFMLLT